MRITNMLHFSEYHRFYVIRDFALSSLDMKMLAAIYQPMVGAFAISLYYTLLQQLPADKAGCSLMEQQRKLFLALELESGERGRKFFIEQTSKLEAIGLLKTTRRFVEASDDYVYEYTLFAPLAPGEFFKNQHLTLLLRDKVGKYMVFSLRDELVQPEPEDLKQANSENLSVPFYELFRLNTQVVDYELEQALFEPSAPDPAERPEVVIKGFQYSDIIMHFPRGSANREFVERLKYEPEQMAKINYVAKKYGLYLTDMCRLLDEDGIFDAGGEIALDLLQHKANLVFRQDKKRSEDRARYLSRVEQSRGAEDGTAAAPAPAAEKAVEMEFYLEVPDIFQGECNQHQYNYILRNEPYTYLLEKIFSKGTVPDGLLDTLAKVDLNYGLSEEVINVLIHYLYVNKRSWSKASIEFSVTDMLAKQVGTYEQAVQYIREQTRYKENKTAPRGGRASANAGGQRGGARVKQKPQLPIVEDTSASATRRTAEEREAMRRRAQMLDGKL
ncbi:Replication initiation and membrane attachment protein [Paenibacillus konkukensis]|uniref:Replication initiation and membrane attachment protein n=1 Tax=Paenibacillus konkukensis TaxID=2020716 RepID=A0ABY4RXV4_9BACL|nr:helicase DnaB [Paenibacillus doosanensis]UQZ86234.1 Replication initiation and membrane attachment protein [Paenibacillus konkukensis]